MKAGSESQRPKGRVGTIEAASHAEKISSIAPAKAVFSFVSALLKLIRVFFLLLCHDPPQVHIQLSRIRRRMNRIMLSLGCFAPISPERLAEGRMERNRTKSVSPCMVQWMDSRRELN